MSVHYSKGSPVDAVCGRSAVVLTGDPRSVDCYSCKETPAWREDAEIVEYAASLPEGSEAEPDVIAFMRKVLADSQMGKWQGTLVDLQSANAVITVYDALSKPEAKAKLAGMELTHMVNTAWKVITRASKPSR